MALEGCCVHTWWALELSNIWMAAHRQPDQAGCRRRQISSYGKLVRNRERLEIDEM